MSARSLVAPTLAALLFTAAPALAADDAAADEAAAKLVASKALAGIQAPAEQWLGSYAGSAWTGAVRIVVTSKDGHVSDIVIERIKSRDAELSEREVGRWSIDSSGAIVKGERMAYEAGHEAQDPDFHFLYRIADGKLSLREAEKPDVDTVDLPKTGAFVPDVFVALLAVPDQKGQVWRFSTFGGEEQFAYYTVEDAGKEKVATRSGVVEARKLIVKDREGAVAYFVDEKHQVVAARWPESPNLHSVAGTAAESRTDWWSRPDDEADKAADKLLAGAGSLDGQSGPLTYTTYNEEGALKSTTTLKYSKETKDGKPAYHYLSTTADVGSESSAATEEWWFTPEGKLIAGRYTQKGAETGEWKLRPEGDKIVSTLSDAPEGKEELSSPAPPRLVADSFCLLRAAAAAGAGSFRFSGYDLADRHAISIYLTVKGEEEIELPSGKAKGRHVAFSQNLADADAWVDAKGQILLVVWKESDRNVFGPLESAPKKIEHVGPAR